MAKVKQDPSNDTDIKVMPMVSAKERYSTSLGMHSSLFMLDQNSGRHLTHVIESVIGKKNKENVITD